MPKLLDVSFYSPSYGNLRAGWYTDQTVELEWTADCELLLEHYAERYAPFLLAYAKQFKQEVLARHKVQLTSKNIGYAVLTRAIRNPKILEKWIDRLSKYEKIVRSCIFCDRSFRPLDTHPNVIENCGSSVRWCRGCNYQFWRYARIWTQDLAQRIEQAKTTAHRKRTCEYCGNGFNLLKHFYSSRSFSDNGMIFTTVVGNEDFAAGQAGVDFLYPNLFVPLCPECFGGCFQSQKASSHREILDALKMLGDLVGKIPTQDFDSYLYLFSSVESVRRFVDLMRVLPSPDSIKTKFGSFFAAISRSGLLPDGARRMRIGTMVEATDGHLCFSLAERDIDNWLFAAGIRHDKEVNYPGSEMRCDWEVFGYSKRIFVEYFGLMNRKEYAERAKQKVELARDAEIFLVELFPDTKWKSLLRNLLLDSSSELEKND